MNEPDINPDLEHLRGYVQAKLALADQLRIARRGLEALGRNEGVRQCEALMVKLAEDHFVLAVLGQFKRGKSSLMNAIIGRQFLPTGVLPLTSAITVLRYGPRERMLVDRLRSIFPEERPVSDLADFVTEKGNPDNVKQVKSVRVEMPVPFLRYGIEFVDTPGVGSAIVGNTATTYGFLPECDAVLFVTAADSPMTSLELDFLREIRQYVHKIFFVVNKVDLLSEEERDQVLGFVAETIRAQTGLTDVRIFPVSSQQGLAARMSGDAVLFVQSGLKALEDTLGAFLSGEKSTVFLSVVAQRVLRILDAEVTPEVTGAAALEARVEALRREKVRTVHQDPREAAEAMTNVRANLQAMSKDMSWRMAPAGKAAGVDQSANKAQGALAADLRTRGCPVCEHLADQAADFFAHWQYKISTEEEAQETFAAELGFCPLHMWQLIAMSSPYGASVGYARLAERLARLLNPRPPEKGGVIKQLVHDSRSCAVCAMLRRAEGTYISGLAALIGEADGRTRYLRSQGACLRHLAMLLGAVSAPEVRESLLLHSAQRFEQDAEDMRNYALKHDALRRSLQNSNEEDAYYRTVARIVGGRDMCTPWPEDGEI